MKHSDPRVARLVRRWYDSRWAVIFENVIIGLMTGLVVVLFRISLSPADMPLRRLYGILPELPSCRTPLWIFDLTGGGYGLIESLSVTERSLGMLAFFVVVVKVPVTEMILILEMGGNFNHLRGLVLVCLSAFVTTGLIASPPVYAVLLKRTLKAGLSAAKDCRLG
ncbi:MAG: chloride channel protein [Treponema sp.]|jgi:H+/Cl- antiporter ClcA|nr:chloride channel protein [Treponema sp.]